MLTNNQIKHGKLAMQREFEYFSDNSILHRHPDCIRVAYQWLDAQTKTKYYTQKGDAEKHIIEDWAGYYVSDNDVQVAAKMHPEIEGVYPRFNITKNRIFPHWNRLKGIREALTQSYVENDKYHFKERYMYFELSNGELETITKAFENRSKNDPLFNNIGFWKHKNKKRGYG